MGARSRFGCLSCKHRKKKCDEQKPICTACLRNSLGCVWPDPITDTQRGFASRLQPLNTRPTIELDARTLVRAAHPDFPTGSIPSCPANFALPGSIAQASETWRLLDHYLKDTANRLACLQDSQNPFLHTLLPAALNDELLMNAILALSGVHMMQRMPQLDRDLQTLTWSSYNRALKQLRVALSTDFNGPVSVDAAWRALLVVLIFYLLEATRGTDHNAMQKHLDGAHHLMTYVNRFGSSATHSSIVSLVTELYVYNSSLASFTVNCPPSSLPKYLLISSSTIPISTYGVMCGCAYELFTYIPKVSALLWEFASHEPVLPKRSCIIEYHALRAQVAKWKPHSEQRDMVLCAELYQQSLLLLLDSHFAGDETQINIENAFQRLQSLISHLSPTSPIATTATWPLFVFGTFASHDHHKVLIRIYLQELIKEFGMGVMSTALDQLQEVWKEEPDPNTVSRFFSNQNNVILIC
ncbi:hypothetical protein N7466_001990 [Penicillium verhagenii]|uniref:uncharacterized protein n=1 Tax=Penicillium verhagenii TaxID=1562060 RepID=UPI00254579B4|nr:uncharacterized protein N7466_001990 [Penicillium verhagenii]KAJ5938856.1 hypothetical protein N7466_001990 [Penicillium verhagenii]